MPDEPATPPSSRAHEFDSTCNCGDCLADRGIEPAPATPPVQPSSRVDLAARLEQTAADLDRIQLREEWYDGMPKLLREAADELTRAATPPEQESSRVDPCPTCGGRMHVPFNFYGDRPSATNAQSHEPCRMCRGTGLYPAPEPAQPPTEQGPTRGNERETLMRVVHVYEDEPVGTLPWAVKRMQERADQLNRGKRPGLSLGACFRDAEAIELLIEAASDPAPTEQGDLAARFEALADLALKKCEEECLSDGAPNPFREEMAQAKAYRYAAELARDHARATSGTEGEA